MKRRTFLRQSGAALLFAGQRPLRLLIATGWYDHAFLNALPCLKKMFTETGRFAVTVTEKLAPPELAGQDVLLVLYNGPRWPAETEHAVERFVGSGHGMVTMHGTTYAFGGVEVRKEHFKLSGIIEKPWPEFVRMIGCRWPEEKLGHGRRHRFPVRFTDREHPITSGLPAELEADDELYHRITLLPQAHVLATAYSAPATKGTGNDEPMMWTTGYGSGRVFHTTLGHDCQAITAPAFHRTVPRAAEWAATGAVR